MRATPLLRPERRCGNRCAPVCVHFSLAPPLSAFGWCLLLVVGFFVAVYTADVASREWGKDPGRVVVDEGIGFFVTVAFLPAGWWTAIAGFFVFRALDIVKPPPARQREVLPGGGGIVADDVMAGIYGNLILGLLFSQLDWAITSASLSLRQRREDMAKTTDGVTTAETTRKKPLNWPCRRLRSSMAGINYALGRSGGVAQIESISTGSLALNAALGIGGLPKGRIIEIAGPEGAGKTMLTLHAVREAQKRGGTAAFIDAEHALDVSFAKRIGVDTENLIISQPDSGEQALEIVDTLVRSGAFDIIVVDSVATLVPQAELEGDMEIPTWVCTRD